MRGLGASGPETQLVQQRLRHLNRRLLAYSALDETLFRRDYAHPRLTHPDFGDTYEDRGCIRLQDPGLDQGRYKLSRALSPTVNNRPAGTSQDIPGRTLDPLQGYVQVDIHLKGVVRETRCDRADAEPR
jgi:hypothetical protein